MRRNILAAIAFVLLAAPARAQAPPPSDLPAAVVEEQITVSSDYRGSFVMGFAGYNAGRGRVKTWVGRYGDPRDANVDAVDWVERIPFAETRNYVQRILENMQVYRARFGGGSSAVWWRRPSWRGGAKS